MQNNKIARTTAASTSNEEILARTLTELNENVERTIIRQNWSDFRAFVRLKRSNFVEKIQNLKKIAARVHTEEEAEIDRKNEENETLAKSIIQTQAYIEEEKKTRVGSDFVDNSLEYYILKLIEHEDTADLNFINELIDDGVDVNYLNKAEENVLFIAIKTQQTDLAQYLIDIKINIKQINIHGCNIFHALASVKNIDIIRVITDNLQKDEIDKMMAHETKIEKQIPLHYAAKEGIAEIVEYYITEFKAKKEARDYKDRTPLFLAAEYNRKTIVKKLMTLKCSVCFTDETKRETLNNKHGQSALYWIVTKMPDIAEEALDQLYEPNQFLRKNKFYLAPLEPKVVKKKDRYLQKSVLASLVESANLDLLTHPVVTCLIDVKWRKFGRSRAFFDLFLTIIYIAVWVAFGLWVPYNQRHTYDFTKAEDRFRLSLFIVGILFTVYLIINEFNEVYSAYKYQEKSNAERKKELQEDLRDTAINQNVINFLKEEEYLIRQNNKFKTFYEYFTDIWNLYDWVAIILLLICIGTHIDDIINHSEFKARLHIRMMSVTIIVVSVRLLKTSRIVLTKFGTLVMILFYSIGDMMIWFILYTSIWLSFCCSIWMLYGGKKFVGGANEDNLCFDVYNDTYNEANNCTTIEIPQLSSYDRTAYSLYRLTFGSDSFVPEDDMSKIDNSMINPLIGLYVALTTLVLVNIFIALLSSTFNRVFDKARAYIILQRAYEILNREKTMTYDARKRHIEYLREECNPHVDHHFDEILTNLDDQVNLLEKELKSQIDNFTLIRSNLESTEREIRQQRKRLNQLTKTIENTVKLNQEYITETNQNLKSIETEVKALKDTLFTFLDVQTKLFYQQNLSQIDNNSAPKFQYSSVHDITFQSDEDSFNYVTIQNDQTEKQNTSTIAPLPDQSDIKQESEPQQPQDQQDQQDNPSENKPVRRRRSLSAKKQKQKKSQDSTKET